MDNSRADFLFCYFLSKPIDISRKRYNKLIETIEIFKALANEHRLQILNWLKHPKDYFVNELHAEIDEEAVGVCVVVGKMWSHRAPLIFFLDDPIRELDWTLGLKEAFS